MKLQLQAHLTDTFYGVNFVSSLSHCWILQVILHVLTLTPERDGFPWLAGCRQLEAVPRTPKKVKESTGSSPVTTPVTHRSLNYQQVKQKTWGGERIPNLPLADAIPSHRDPGYEKLRIPRHFQWENPLSWERNTRCSAAISCVSPLCITMPCSQHWN